jgi:hypothetical protein
MLEFVLFVSGIVLLACGIIAWLALLCRHTHPQREGVRKRVPASNLK